MTPDPTQLLQPFSLTRTLAVLQPGSALQLVPFSQRGSVQSDWIIGIRAFTDSTSVHGSHWERHPRGDEMLTVLLEFSPHLLNVRLVDVDERQHSCILVRQLAPHADKYRSHARSRVGFTARRGRALCRQS
ncbi:hypothetical protein CBM2589_U10188 [Cupriavidus taiwanensis]|uniref:Uncharacterized protein n=1 Tax=Cupriavidus taiwanensis TaxID=164546 RepID=A0A375CQK2_9BURK|nr:hypothetical protein [Cupriavidus taiwanensis]SOY77686.1 hypothetical protein CBM2589_U10188 [Cupriavidus taiwanensis]